MFKGELGKPVLVYHPPLPPVHLVLAFNLAERFIFDQTRFHPQPKNMGTILSISKLDGKKLSFEVG